MLKVEKADDVKMLIDDVIDTLDLRWIDKDRVEAVRSRGSRSYALARIYGLPRVFQVAYNLKPLYVIEVLSERFDSLSETQKLRVIIHELLHIPRSFSGGLRRHGKYVNERLVENMLREYFRRKHSM